MQRVQAETAGPDMAEPDHSQEISQPSGNIRQIETDLENISLTFNRENDFGYIGSAQNLFQSEDGVVIPKFGQ